MTKLTEAEVHSFLVKMADDFDREGNHDLASSVDKTIKSFSSRPKAPLKKLDDDVKKNLIVFVHDADQNTGKSVNGLKELFRRLRYFDLADAIKETGLEKVVKDMEKTQGCLDGAKKRLFELMMGKKPSEQDLRDMVGDDANDGLFEQNALDFFESQSADDIEEEDVERDGPGQLITEDEARNRYEEFADEIDTENLHRITKKELMDLDKTTDEGKMGDEMEDELASFLESLEEDEMGAI